MDDLMIDLETLGDSQNSAIVQIGACYFNRITGRIGDTLSLYIDIEDSLKYGEITPSTIQWWLQQSKKAQDSVFGKDKYKHTLNDALLIFQGWVGEESQELKIWCHAPF